MARVGKKHTAPLPNTWLLRPEENKRGKQEEKAEVRANGANRQTRLKVMNNTFTVTYFFMPIESPRSDEPSQECKLCIQRKKGEPAGRSRG